MSDLSARMSARVNTGPSTPVRDTFRAPADDMQRATVYLPRDLVKALKQAALDDNTSMSKILTEQATQWLTQRRKDVKT